MLNFKKEILFLLIVGASPAGAVNLLVNGDLEAGDETGWMLQNGPSSDSKVVNYSAYSIAPSTEYGSYLMRFNADNLPPAAIFSQEFVTIAGESHDLNFEFGQWGPNTNLQRLSVMVEDVSTGDVLLSAIVQDASNVTTLTNLYDKYSYRFEAAGALTRLKFSDISIGTVASDGVLDNIAVVPEVSPILAVPSLFGLLAIRTRKRKLSE